MKDTADNYAAQGKRQDLLSDALAYAAKGWPIFPCEPAGKDPIAHLAPQGFKNATTDPAIIRDWWAQVPDANIGLALSAAGMMAVDADLYKPDCQFEAWNAEHPLPATLTQRSARGGTHFLFQAEPGAKYLGKPAFGVDGKHNGYILLAPSRFAGGAYAWQNDLPPAPAPAHLKRPERKLTEVSGNTPGASGRTLAEAEDALRHISPDLPYDDWMAVLMGLHDEFGDDAVQLADEWSARAPHRYREGLVDRKFASFTASDDPGRVTISTLFKMARDGGADLGQLRHQHTDMSKFFHPVPPTEPTIFEQIAARETAEPRFHASLFTWRDPKQMPPREWLFGKHLIRGFASLTVAPGALGKSSLLTVEMLAMASGRPLLGEAPPFPLRVWAWNGEDPRDELDRRFHAAAMHYGLTPEDLDGRLMIDSGRDMPITIATSANGGISIVHPVVDALVDALRAAKVDVFVVDPFVTTHQVTENDTTGMNAVAAQWRNVADRAGCAIELVHHVSKAAAMDMDAAGIYASRGSGSIIDAVRSARYLSRMTKDEASRLGVDNPSQFFRVNAGKENMAPAANATWRRMIGVQLHNGASYWPAGDTIGVCTAWTAPEALEGITDEHVAAVLRLISKAGERRRYSEKADQWVGHMVAEAIGLDIGRGTSAKERTPEQQSSRVRVRRALDTWLADGVLQVVRARCPRKREDVDFVVAGRLPQHDLGVFG